MSLFKGVMKSVTLWFNGVLIMAMPIFEYAAMSLPQLQEYMTAETYKMIGLIAVGGNIALRFKTNKPLKDK
jgi:hypothetical protein